jgi:hypothetical protein
MGRSRWILRFRIELERLSEIRYDGLRQQCSLAAKRICREERGRTFIACLCTYYAWTKRRMFQNDDE